MLLRLPGASGRARYERTGVRPTFAISDADGKGLKLLGKNILLAFFPPRVSYLRTPVCSLLQSATFLQQSPVPYC